MALLGRLVESPTSCGAGRVPWSEVESLAIRGLSQRIATAG